MKPLFLIRPVRIAAGLGVYTKTRKGRVQPPWDTEVEGRPWEEGQTWKKQEHWELVSEPKPHLFIVLRVC